MRVPGPPSPPGPTAAPHCRPFGWDVWMESIRMPPQDCTHQHDLQGRDVLSEEQHGYRYRHCEPRRCRACYYGDGTAVEARVVGEVGESEACRAQRRPYRHCSPVGIKPVRAKSCDDEWQWQCQPQHLDEDGGAHAADTHGNRPGEIVRQSPGEKAEAAPEDAVQRVDVSSLRVWALRSGYPEVLVSGPSAA